jgi:hypothetical protein
MLRGKLNIWVGESDDYYLEDAVRLLKVELEALGADARIEIIPELGHNVWTDEVRQSLHERIDSTLEDFE